MAKKLSGWKTKGMNQDLSVSAFNPEFAFENMNLRLSTNEGNTTMSWVNEKGTESVGLFVYTPPSGGQPGGYSPTEIKGVTVGTAVINHMLILFVTDPKTHYDYIYRLTFIDHTKTTMQVDTLFGTEDTESYQVSLGFDTEHPLETLVSYESEHIQKVYWTDGINQPRLINVAPDNDDKISKYNSTSFDFITTLQLNETIKVQKILGGGGMFAPGVIQYCFTYYNKYGQESNIFYTTPLFYISHQDRGGSPEDKIDNAFRISIEKVDTNFDFLRIYSIQRTSINAVPLCKRVQDIAIDGLDETSSGSGIYKASYIDTGLNGDTIDPMELLYKGGNVINVGTMEQKDNTLFMGDITTPQNKLPVIDPQNPITLEVGERKFFPLMISTDNYEYSSQLTAFKAVEENGEYVKTEESVPCAGFKYGDFYRCGVQFQDETGKWTDPIFIDDKEIVEETQEPEELEEVQEEEEPVEPLHAPYITTNMQEEGIYEMGITVEVANTSSNPITINPEAHIVIEVETSPEPETRRIDGEGGETVYKAQILTVVLGNFASYTIASQQTETFSNAVVRYGKLYYGASFCTDVALLASVGKTVNCDLTDAGGDTDTLIMSNVTWDNTTPGQETPCLPSQNPHGYTYTFTCTSSPVPGPGPEPPGPGPEPPSGDLGEFLYKVGLISDLHICVANDQGTDGTGSTPSTDDDNWWDEADFRDAMNIFTADTDVKFIATCGDIAESQTNDYSSHPEATCDTDYAELESIYDGPYWQTAGLRLFSPLGNHDYYGMFESRSGDTITNKKNSETTVGYNAGVFSRLSLWPTDQQINGIVPDRGRIVFELESGKTIPQGQADMRFFSYNDYVDLYARAGGYTGASIWDSNKGGISDEAIRCAKNYVNSASNWGTVKNSLVMWDDSSGHGRNGYSKFNYWLKKDDDIYIFLSLDYGNDVWGVTSGWHDRVMQARTIINVNDDDPYIRRMVEYVGNTGYSSVDEDYNYQYYSPNTLIWLKELLENNTDKKIYVFTHHFMPHRVGNGDPEHDAIPKNGGYQYAYINANGVVEGPDDDTPGINKGSNTLTGIEFWFINKLMNSYQNVIWFSGHSHISWENDCHFSNRDYNIVSPTERNAYVYTRGSNTPKQGYSGWAVSLPSLSKPRLINNGSSSRIWEDAEMAIMEVYQNGVKIKGYKIKEDNVYVYDVNNPLVEKTIILKSSSPDPSEEEVLRRSASTPTESARSTVSIDPIPTIESVMVTVPVIKGTIPAKVAEDLISSRYKKARAVVVYPDMQSRKVLCQGVGCPTLYTANHREKSLAESTGDLWAQSSWFFRPKNPSSYEYLEDVNTPPSEDLTNLEYMVRDGSPLNIKRVEIQGHYGKYNKFTVDWTTLTFHSPDIEFDDNMANLDYASDALDYTNVGEASFLRTFSDIDIQTETPTISNKGAGFVKKSFVKNRAYGIISGLFWDDYEVDDDVSSDENNMASPFTAFTWQKAPMKWLVYLWNRTGSLNNDIERPADSGVQSAVLKRKIISNLRFANTNWIPLSETQKSYKSSLFYSDQPEILKLDIGNPNKANVYMGNIDTMLISDEMDGMYFALSGDAVDYSRHYSSPSFNSEVRWGTFEGSDGSQGNRWYNDDGNWFSGDSTKEVYKFMTSVGNIYKDIVLKKCSVRMKYKSTPHVVMIQRGDGSIYSSVSENTLPIFELGRNISINPEEENYFPVFGGRSKDALKANVWIPCGEPVNLENTKGAGGTQGPVEFEYSWGDTYYQRWDCLKTYAFTPEDINQVVEIGSFMLETRVNIDGRYDRNRGQLSNLYMSPRNFNLINPVYSQLNNFFTYRIQDDDAYNEKKYPNQITWSKTKTSGADVDLWTNVTLASVLEMDGDKGKVRKLARLNNNLICFQDKGIAQVLYNDRVQINTQDGVPIEISNSDKVQGKNYISDSIGCSNKWSMAQTPSGIYFMDSINKAIFMFNGQLNNLSGSMGFNTWSKKNIPLTEDGWTPVKYYIGDQQEVMASGFGDFVSYYDKLNQDVLFINKDIALAFSERLGTFTSFYNYGMSPFLCNVDDTEIWLRTGKEVHEEGEGQQIVRTVDNLSTVWKHQAGDYCSFFGVNKPYWMTLVGNPEPQMDKIFTNLEFRACVEGDGEYNDDTGNFTPALPFDSLETWDEYQHGKTTLENRNGHSAMVHHAGSSSSLKRKFRIWRCDIPRDNYAAPEVDNERGIYRYHSRPIDRMRNPWLYLSLYKSLLSDAEVDALNANVEGTVKTGDEDAENPGTYYTRETANEHNSQIEGATLYQTGARTEIHDIVMTYFD